MGYCHNCGKPVSHKDAFCGDCGTNLGQSDDSATEYETTKNSDKTGYIFTNIEALSHKLQVKSSWIKDQLLQFTEAKKAFGVNYLLIDVSNYKPQLSVNRENKIKLSPTEPWQTHHRLLTDRYVYDTEQAHLDVEYLFIIGGHDIIPMPVVSNYMPQNDPEIDTDLPYTYLYGQHTEELLSDASLFFHTPMLHVGRLPLAVDAQSDDLVSYLKRNLQVSQDGFPRGSFYGQCDPHWKKVSECVVENVISERESNLDNSENYIYHSLVLTPGVTITEEEFHPKLGYQTKRLSNFFNKYALLYYFNLHGSNFPYSGNFIGEIQPSTKTYLPGISPAEIGKAGIPNLIVTEACYGARFIGATKDNSILLSAIHNQTMLYLGSSRTSVGAVDRSNSDIYISYADIIARCFIDAFFAGYDAAQSLFYCRQQVILSDPESPATYMTVLEFNLFGDPTLTLEGMNANESKSGREGDPKKFEESKTLLHKENYSRIEIKEVSTTGSGSILDRVRQAVDNHINNINQQINEHLYAQYGIRPRGLKHIFELKVKQKKNYLYIYEKDELSQVWVTVDEVNQIKKVSITK